MSRFYKIVVGSETVAPTGFPTASGNAGAVWTNYIPPAGSQPGRADTGAQMVEFDVWLYNFDDPVSLGSIKIFGVSKEQVAQASDFNGADIQMFAGMQPGLPLATDAFNSGQQGIILSGQIFNAFGNWQGVNQTLDFVIIPNPGGTQSDPASLSFSWTQGQQLSDVIRAVLSAAFPKFKPADINIDSSLVLAHDETFVFQTLTQFARYIRGVSQDIKGGNYNGVLITQQGDKFMVFDGTAAAGAAATTGTTIFTKDLIGQITWLGPNSISFSTVMRADVRIGDSVTFEPIAGLQAITNAQSASNVRQANTFAGSWQITKIRLVGNSRAPDAQSWVATFQAISSQASPKATSTSDSSS